MADKKIAVSGSFVLRELGQLKALADPLRQRLLRAFAGKPRTTKQVAHCLKEKPTKLYHHVDTLAEAGLLKLVKTQQKRGTTERYYQAAAKKFSVHRNIFRHLHGKASGEQAAPDALFENAFTNALEEIRHQLGKSTSGAGNTALLQAQLRVTPTEAVVLRNKIQRLLENYAERKLPRRSRKPTDLFEVLLAIYPSGSPRRRR